MDSRCCPRPMPAGDGEDSVIRVPVYVAFDFDNDQELKHLLIGHAKNPDSPFNVADFSLKEAAPERNWQEKARPKIRQSKKVVVIVGDAKREAVAGCAAE